jgi:hypothetical protein
MKYMKSYTIWRWRNAKRVHKQAEKRELHKKDTVID